MKALILAAGLGTRLRPLTETIPKPLLPIAGKPLLAYHLDSLSRCGITDVLINTHYLHEKIEDFVLEAKKDFPDLNIQTSFEAELLGSAGTLKENREFFKNEEDFLIVYGDNLTNINYQNLLEIHEKEKGLVTIASYFEEHPESKGIISFDEKNRILKFIEKPKGNQVISNYANAGIYVLNKKVFEYLKQLDKEPLDFGHDFFPFLLGKDEDMYVYKMNEILLDIGNIENYNKSQDIALKL